MICCKSGQQYPPWREGVQGTAGETRGGGSLPGIGGKGGLPGEST